MNDKIMMIVVASKIDQNQIKFIYGHVLFQVMPFFAVKKGQFYIFLISLAMNKKN